MKKPFLILFINVLGIGLMAQSFDCEEELFPKKDKKTRLFGYVNAIGEYRVPPKFLTAKPFVGRNAIVQEGKMFGIINCEGVLVLPADYTEISSFSNGKGWVKSNGLWGLADAKGRLLIKPIYEEIKEINTFSGTATWVKKAGHWGLMNKENGRFIVNLQYEDISNISDSAGIARKLGMQDLVYYGDGRVIISEMKRVNRLTQNLFVYQNKEGKFGAFNSLAFIIIRPDWDTIKLSIPLVMVKKENKYGLKTLKGKEVLEPKYDKISNFTDGYCAARKDNLWYIYSTSGAIASPPNEILFSKIGKGAKAIIYTKDLCGLWDLKQRKWILEGKKQSIIFSLSQNWVSIFDSGKFKILDLSKGVPVEQIYDSLSSQDSDQMVRAYKNNKVTITSYPSFSEGTYFESAIPTKLEKYFLAGDEQNYGLISANNKLIIDVKYQKITILSGKNENYIVPESNKKQSLFDESGKIILNPEFSKIYPGVKQTTIYVKESKWGIVKNTGEILIEPKFDSITTPKKEFDLVDFPVIGWKKGKVQLIDEKGVSITEPEKVDWISLGEGAWAKKTKDGYSLFNNSGNAQGSLLFEQIEAFQEGSAPVKLGGNWGFINLYGKLNIPNQFEQVLSYKSGLAYAKQNGKWGVLKKNGAWLIKPIGIGVELDEDGKRKLVIP